MVPGWPEGMRNHHALAGRLLAREYDYVRFATDPRLPFDNNARRTECRTGELWEGSLRERTRLAPTSKVAVLDGSQFAAS